MRRLWCRNGGRLEAEIRTGSGDSMLTKRVSTIIQLAVRRHGNEKAAVRAMWRYCMESLRRHMKGLKP